MRRPLKADGFWRAVFFPCLVLAVLRPAPAAAGYLQVESVAGVKTRISGGCLSVQELANIAHHRGIDVVIYGDRLQRSLQYGIWPFENIFRRKEDAPAVLTYGAREYIAQIDGEEKKSGGDMVLLPAADSAPFYYWTGSILGKDLAARGADKRLLVLGLPAPDDYRLLPILDGERSSRYVSEFLNPFLAAAVSLLACLALVYKKKVRLLTVPLTALAALLTANLQPFRSSPFDPYHGDRGAKPYQEAIDYAAARGGMTFWEHLEAKPGLDHQGAFALQTAPHPEVLALTEEYAGFEGLDDTPVKAAETGNEWDHVLGEYLRGKRKKPVWLYGGNDFSCEGRDNHVLGGARTVMLVPEKSRPAVLDAMRRGRMYAVRQPAPDNRLSLDAFLLADPATGAAATLGQELPTMTAPAVKIKLRSTKGDTGPVEVSLIRNGEVVRKETGMLPYELEWRDFAVTRKGRGYYRVKAEVAADNYLLSNPVFVQFADTPAEVASLLPRLGKPPATPAPKMKTAAVPPPPAPEIAPVPALPAKPPETPQVTPSPPHHETAVIEKPEPETPKKETVHPPAVEKKEPPPPQPAPKPEPPKAPVAKPPVTPSPREPAVQFVIPRIDGVVLKGGAGTEFPEVGTANKTDRLTLVKRTTVLFNNQPWLMVKKGNLTAYVWEPLVKQE